MNTPSRTISGISAVLFGVFLTFEAFRDDFVILFISIPIIILGVIIFFNKKEDEIEKIKNHKNL